MAFIPKFTLENIKWWEVTCPNPTCHWHGLIADCICPIDDLVRCPECLMPIHVDDPERAIALMKENC